MSEVREEVPESPAVPARRRWWLWLPAGCFGFLLVMFLLGFAVVSGRARSRWKEFGPRHADLRARVQGRAVEREPLEGPAVPGNAFDAYVTTCAAFWKMSTDDKSAIDDARTGKGGEETRKKAFAVLDAHAADLEALRKAAHLDSYHTSLRWEDGWAAQLEWLGPTRFATRALELSAKRRREGGDLDGAIDDVATIAQIGVDTGSAGPAICALVGSAVLRLALNQGAELAISPGLSPPQSARLARLFERAEAGLRPLEDMLEADHLLINETMAALAEGRGSLDNLGFPAAARALAWRHGFSWRVVAADVDLACAQVSSEGREMSARPWPEARDAYEQSEQKWEKDPFMSLLFVSSSSLDRAGRSLRARLRLVRAVAHERATGAALSPVPEDPFTLKPLHRLESGGSSRLWSEWTDGDQGGTGKFEDDPATTGDIPIEWKAAK